MVDRIRTNRFTGNTMGLKKKLFLEEMSILTITGGENTFYFT